MARKQVKTSAEKLKAEIETLKKQKEIEMNKKLEEFEKTDPGIISLNNRINSYSKLLKKKEEQELKVLEIEMEIEEILVKGSK